MNPGQFDDALRQALRRQDPGADFTARVLAQASAPRRRWWHEFVMPRLRWAAAATMLAALVVAGAVFYHDRRERVEGEMAKRQLVVALRIAGTKLRLAQSKVVHLGAAGHEEAQ